LDIPTNSSPIGDQGDESMSLPTPARVIRSVVVIGALLPVTFAGVAAPAAAQQQGPTLTGEDFAAGNAPGASGLTINCNADGSGTANYTVQGQATGPFPGPYSETATATFGPRRSATSNSSLQSFSVNFTVTSGTTEIHGTKQVTPGPDSVAVCAADGTGSLNFRTTYTATIQTPSGTSTDTGCAFGFSQKVPTGVTDSFHEHFFSAGDPACAPDRPVDLVRDLAASGVLSQGNANSLLSKLDAAEASAANGNATAAINQLRAFISEVQAAVRRGDLTSQQGQALIDAANHRIDQLDGP
jgi:hypothetical protein